MSRVLNLLLTHEAPDAVERMLRWWRECCPPEDVLVAYGGNAAGLAGMAHAKIQVDDQRLRTVRHSHQRQSYTGVWRETALWLQGRDFTHVHFVEYDHLPLVSDLNARQLARMDAERADVLGFQLVRVDGSNQPHFLYHAHLPGFFEHWDALSVRNDKRVVLSMFGSGSFWTREAFDAVARHDEPFPIYLELYLPTLAHHLGFRLRDWGDQNACIHSVGDFTHHLDEARSAGAWTIHPVKTMWTR